MELAYLPDSLSFIHGRQLYTQESWVNVNCNADSKKQPKYQATKINEKNCQICRERRKKTLSNYIKSKQIKDSQPNSHLREEDEEES